MNEHGPAISTGKKRHPRAWVFEVSRNKSIAPSIASLVVLVFPLGHAVSRRLRVNILIYGSLRASAFNLVYGYLGLLSFGPRGVVSAPVPIFWRDRDSCTSAACRVFAAIGLGILGGTS